MLPSILDVAENNGLTLNSRTLNKIEVRAKCPFCLEDSTRQNKFFLSLNIEKNVYKCWYCKQSGGVLDFETRLTGKTYQEVHDKYFGKNRKKRHYAEYLSPQQLKMIGWNDYKRKNREDFLMRCDEVLQDWKEYCYKEAVKHFALFMVVAYIPNQERTTSLLEYILESCEKTTIQSLFTNIQREFILDEENRSNWALEGTKLARAAWRSSLLSGDNQMQHVLKHVLFLFYISKINMTDTKIKKAVI